MKMILAVIQPARLPALHEALEKIGVSRLTICDALGYGQQRGRLTARPGHEPKSTLLRKVQLEIMVNDDFVERTIETIASIARSGPEGEIGDGKVFVVPAVEAIQIDDRLAGPGAV